MLQRIENTNLYIGDKKYRRDADGTETVVHACKSAHRKRLKYKVSLGKDHPSYTVFEDGQQLYINWIDDPVGKYFYVETFNQAMDFMNRHIIDKKVIIHCDQGHSRSAVLGMLYSAKRLKIVPDDFEKAVSEFRILYPAYAPSGIAIFVLEHWGEFKKSA